MSEREPTRDELLAMAYVDGELGSEERTAFEARLADEPELLREVADLDRLNVLARQMTPREPKDIAWQRLGNLHGHGTEMGMFASIVGTLGILLWAMFHLFTSSEIDLFAKACLGLLLGGLGLMFILMLRARLRTLPYDPYTDVER